MAEDTRRFMGEAKRSPYMRGDDVAKFRRSTEESNVKMFLSSLAARFPDLRKKLQMANMDQEPSEFVAKVILTAFIYSIVITLLASMIFYVNIVSPLLALPFLPLMFIAFFFFFMQQPTVRASKRAREVDKELVFAGRQMLIELRAGIPMFDSMLSISKEYGEVSKEFNKIVEKISVGVPMDIAMHEVSEQNPSSNFKRVILQLVNSLRSGSDVVRSLEVVLDQITREQMIQMRSYGQKLNPLAMFYMLFGVILPSLGIALSIILFSLIGQPLGPSSLILVLVVIALMQYIFLSIIDSSRPNFDIS
ncbi:Type II secretion system (T2SS), protein F [Candidatus Gugararchaeum adminiculabundum]|nr:Type II secretion system (T2SS), protein F [Candidatus Gugararchaeum adminiculabundum]